MVTRILSQQNATMCHRQRYENCRLLQQSLIHICVEPLEEMAELVGKLFSPIAKHDVESLPMINEHPFGPNEMGVCTIRG